MSGYQRSRRDSAGDGRGRAQYREDYHTRRDDYEREGGSQRGGFDRDGRRLSSRWDEPRGNTNRSRGRDTEWERSENHFISRDNRRRSRTPTVSINIASANIYVNAPKQNDHYSPQHSRQTSQRRRSRSPLDERADNNQRAPYRQRSPRRSSRPDWDEGRNDTRASQRRKSFPTHNARNRSTSPPKSHPRWQNREFETGISALRVAKIPVVSVSDLRRLEELCSLENSSQLRSSSDFKRELDAMKSNVVTAGEPDFELWPVLLIGIPHLLGSWHITNREEYLESVKNGRIPSAFACLRGWMGDSKLLFWIEYCLEKNLFTSRETLLQHIGVIGNPNIQEELNNLDWWKNVPEAVEKFYEVPPAVQFQLLGYLTEISETALWEFARPLIPEVLSMLKCYCPQQIELLKWNRIFQNKEILDGVLSRKLNWRVLDISEKMSRRILFRAPIEVRNLWGHRNAENLTRLLIAPEATKILLHFLNNTAWDSRVEEVKGMMRRVGDDNKSFLRQTRRELKDECTRIEGLQLSEEQATKAKARAAEEMIGRRIAHEEQIEKDCISTIKIWQEELEEKRRQQRRESRNLRTDKLPRRGYLDGIRVESFLESKDYRPGSPELDNLGQILIELER